MIKLALFEPEIPHNTGALMRLCACLDIQLELIEPLGFLLTDKHLKRAGMDYRDMANVTRHENQDAFWANHRQLNQATQLEPCPTNQSTSNRVILLDTKGETSLYQFSFLPGDTLLMGKESSGVPTDVYERCNHVLSIPMKAGCRSLNMALAASMAVGEALRQIRFPII